MTKEQEKEFKRIQNLLHEWIDAAQSGGIYFGKVLQEPSPKRLREAIQKTVKNEQGWNDEILRLLRENMDLKEQLKLVNSKDK